MLMAPKGIEYCSEHLPASYEVIVGVQRNVEAGRLDHFMPGFCETTSYPG